MCHLKDGVFTFWGGMHHLKDGRCVFRCTASHRRHFLTRMSKPCSKCSQSITGNTYSVPGHGTYCRTCYSCNECQQKLVAPFFPVAGGPEHTYVCQKCFSCAVCGQPISNSDEHLLIGDKRLHNKCLQCQFPACGKSLSSKKIWKLQNGMPACEAHSGN